MDCCLLGSTRLCSVLLRLVLRLLFFFTILLPPRSTLFPYTTLFRSSLSPARAVEVTRTTSRHRTGSFHLDSLCGGGRSQRYRERSPRKNSPRRRRGRTAERNVSDSDVANLGFPPRCFEGERICQD